VQLSASGGVVYYWSPATGLNNINSSTPIASIQSTIRYHVVVADENNCMSTDSVLIVAHPQPQFGVVIPDDSVCAGTSVHLKAFGGDSYQWTPVDGLTDPTASEPLTVLQSSSTYTVKITESVCKEQASFTIPVVIKQLQPIVVTKSNDITCNNPSAILNSNIVANTYLWSPSASLSNPTIESPVASPTSNTIYTLTIRDTAGCISSGSIEVKVLNNADFKLYQMPTAFTPGGDGKNDCFGVSKWGTLNIIYFLIYNRWGQLVFKGTDSKACWDGTFRGQVQSSGNYVYKLKALTLCGVVERTGNVVLIR
jgi:gliding motility-associated-like protein